MKDNNNYPLKNISNKIHHPKFSMNSSEHIQKKKKGHSKYSISNLANLNKENNPLSHSRHSSQTSYDINHKKYGIKKWSVKGYFQKIWDSRNKLFNLIVILCKICLVQSFLLFITLLFHLNKKIIIIHNIFFIWKTFFLFLC